MVRWSYLKQWWKHLKCVDSTGTIWVWDELVEVTSPGLLCIVTNCWLESSKNGREEGWRRRWRAGLQHVIIILFRKTKYKNEANWINLTDKLNIYGWLWLGTSVSCSVGPALPCHNMPHPYSNCPHIDIQKAVRWQKETNRPRGHYCLHPLVTPHIGKQKRDIFLANLDGN